MKILIADDEAVPRELLRKVVESVGDHQVTVAKDGAAAWELLEYGGRGFDVVFLDLKMPGLDGFDLLQRIRQTPALNGVEVVLCTGANDRPTITKAIQLGARHYVVKPCTAPVIAAKLSQIQARREPGEQRLAGAA